MTEQHWGPTISGDIVVIGGGSAGIGLLASLLKRDPQLNIILIEPSEHHCYQPAWTLVGGGTITTSGPVNMQVKVWPTPDTSAASGLYIIGSRSPDPMSVSGCQVPRPFIAMVPLLAAMFVAEHIWRSFALPPEERPSIAQVARAYRMHGKQTPPANPT